MRGSPGGPGGKGGCFIEAPFNQTRAAKARAVNRTVRIAVGLKQSSMIIRASKVVKGRCAYLTHTRWSTIVKAPHVCHRTGGIRTVHGSMISSRSQLQHLSTDVTMSMLRERKIVTWNTFAEYAIMKLIQLTMICVKHQLEARYISRLVGKYIEADTRG